MKQALANDFTVQTPQHTLSEIADTLWACNEHTAYRAVMAYIKEREQMLDHIKFLERG